MNAVAEIRQHGEMFNWKRHSEHAKDTFIHADHMVAVDYRRDGTVDAGRCYLFRSIDDLVLQEVASDRNKRSSIISWLIKLGS